jgi:hypothetical protein
MPWLRSDMQWLQEANLLTQVFTKWIVSSFIHGQENLFDTTSIVVFYVLWPTIGLLCFFKTNNLDLACGIYTQRWLYFSNLSTNLISLSTLFLQSSFKKPYLLWVIDFLSFLLRCHVFKQCTTTNFFFKSWPSPLATIKFLVGKLSSVSVERRTKSGEQRLESGDWRAEILDFVG